MEPPPWDSDAKGGLPGTRRGEWGRLASPLAQRTRAAQPARIAAGKRPRCAQDARQRVGSGGGYAGSIVTAM
jgi:hypothetical protein